MTKFYFFDNFLNQGYNGNIVNLDTGVIALFKQCDNFKWQVKLNRGSTFHPKNIRLSKINLMKFNLVKNFKKFSKRSLKIYFA